MMVQVPVDVADRVKWKGGRDDIKLQLPTF